MASTPAAQSAGLMWKKIKLRFSALWILRRKPRRCNQPLALPFSLFVFSNIIGFCLVRAKRHSFVLSWVCIATPKWAVHPGQRLQWGPASGFETREARLAKAFGMNVRAWSRSLTSEACSWVVGSQNEPIGWWFEVFFKNWAYTWHPF